MWNVELDRGRASAFHQRDVPPDVQPSVWWFEVTHPAIVLGSAQPVGDLDTVACELAGVDVVRRRSGGGAVLLEPDDVLWADVVIPAGHALWTNDVTSSAWWLGDVWRETLNSLGMYGTEVYRGPMRHTTWSRQVCFAGVAGGELLLGDRKVVGVSQRRTRGAARFQCAIYQRWRPQAHVPLFAAPGPTLEDLVGLVEPVTVSFTDVRRAFADALNALG